MISQETIEEVKGQAKLHDIVGDYLTLKRQGSRFVGLCPFHNEKTPSFHVRDDGASYYCFGCGASGNAITFLMEMRGLSFPEAVEELAGRYGIEVKKGSVRGEKRSDPSTNELYKINEVSLLFFRQSLKSAPQAVKDYLKDRGLTSGAVEKFLLGYAPDDGFSLRNFLKSRSVSDDSALRAGIVRRGKSGALYDTFRGRLIFPVLTGPRRVSGFGGRIIPGMEQEDAPKYLNSSESPIYHKHKILFGLPQALNALRASRSCFVVEGYMDVVSLSMNGVENVVATCGTALSEDHGEVLSRLVPKVELLFDGDKGGRGAAAKAFSVFLNVPIDARVIFLPEGEDPDSIAMSSGRNSVSRIRSFPQSDLLEAFLRHVALKDAGVPLEELSEALSGRVAKKLVEQLKILRDPVVRDRLIEVAAFRLRVQSASLRELIAGGVTSSVDAIEFKVEEIDGSTNIPAVRELTRLERELVSAMMVRREELPKQLLASQVVGLETLNPVVVHFAEGLVAASTLENKEAGKAAIIELLKHFGPTWQALWVESYALARGEGFDFLRLFQDCLAKLRKEHLISTIRELDTSLPLAGSDEEKALLYQQRLLVSKRLREIEEVRS